MCERCKTVSQALVPKLCYYSLLVSGRSSGLFQFWLPSR